MLINWYNWVVRIFGVELCPLVGVIVSLIKILSLLRGILWAQLILALTPTLSLVLFLVSWCLLTFIHEFSPEFIAVFPSSDKLFSDKLLFSTIFSDIDEMGCAFFLATSSGDSLWKNPHLYVRQSFPYLQNGLDSWAYWQNTPFSQKPLFQ